jgi:Cu+-exporting ATPase
MKETPTKSASIDPVCGMKVDPARAAGSHEHEGQTYFFCSRGCLEKFKADPARYLRKQEASSPLVQIGGFPPAKPAEPAVPPTSTAADAVIYTCPMHPEVRQKGPGSCPICGMALEPEMVTEEEAPNPELVDMSRRFWIAALLSAPVLALGMMETQRWIQFALATPVVLWSGWPLFTRAWASVANRSPNMFTLIGMGVGTAYLYSAIAMLAPRIFPHELSAHGGLPPVYFEAAAVITTLVLLGQVLELRARSRTSSAIKALLGLVPKTARRVGADGS